MEFLGAFTVAAYRHVQICKNICLAARNGKSAMGFARERGKINCTCVKLFAMQVPRATDVDDPFAKKVVQPSVTMGRTKLSSRFSPCRKFNNEH